MPFWEILVLCSGCLFSSLFQEISCLSKSAYNWDWNVHSEIWDTYSHICISFIHSIGVCRMRRFLAILRSFFHSCLLCTFSYHPSPPTILPSSLTPSCLLFVGLPLNLVVPKFIYNTLLGILFSSILCTCPNKHNLFKLIVSIIAGFLTLA